MRTLTAKVKHMVAGRCDRCGGLMVREYVAELDSECWKCVICGERVDALILAHREEGAGIKESSEHHQSTSQGGSSWER